MKKLILLFLSLFICTGCLSTSETTGLVNGINQGMLLSNPDNSYLNIIEQQNRLREIQKLNRQLDNINHSLRMQTIEQQNLSHQLMIQNMNRRSYMLQHSMDRFMGMDY